MRVNYDTLHVWEGGDDPLLAHAKLAEHIDYYHLKNVRSRSDLGVFSPANVYAAAGCRTGMTSLFEGALDYRGFLEMLPSDSEVSLEWFGNRCQFVLESDLRAVRQRSRAAPLQAIG